MSVHCVNFQDVQKVLNTLGDYEFIIKLKAFFNKLVVKWQGIEQRFYAGKIGPKENAIILSNDMA